MSYRKVVLVTGASSGIGKAIVEKLALDKDQYQVFGTTRNPQSAPFIKDVTSVALDVTSDESVKRCLATVIEQTGRIDILVNNAGATLQGALEETEMEEAKKLFETNFFGVVRMIKQVLPYMRAQKEGRVINMSSVAGIIPKPYESMYAATKHALEGLTESLAYEVNPFGIQTILIEPGFIRTQLSYHASMAALSLASYQEQREIALSHLEQDIAQGASPEKVASIVKKAMEAHKPKLRYLVGGDAKWVSVLRWLLPHSLFAWGLQRRLLKK